MAHDGSEGLSPDGWLPDRISVGVLARVFTPELVDAAVADAGAREQRRRLLPARLVMYFVLALWLFRGRNCGYGQVMTKLADGLYHQRRAAGLLAGQQLDPGGWVDAGQGRRWKPPNISSLSRGRGKLGPAPVRFLFEQVAGLIGDEGAPGVSCCGLRVVSIDGPASDVPDSKVNDEHFGRPSNQTRDGAFAQVRWLAAAESGTGSLLGASMGPYRDSEQALARDLLEQGCFGPGMLVLADRKFLSWALAREFLATGARILWRASASFALKPVKVLPDGTYLAELAPPRKMDGAACCAGEEPAPDISCELAYATECHASFDRVMKREQLRPGLTGPLGPARPAPDHHHRLGQAAPGTLSHSRPFIDPRRLPRGIIS